MMQTELEYWQTSSADLVKGVALPLKNLEFTIEQYLLDNGTRLDAETRFLLAGVRDCLGRVACSSVDLIPKGE